MKRRFLSLLTAFALCLTLIPTTAFADDEESGEDVPPCICETACTEEVMNPDCPVCGAEDARPEDCRAPKLADETGGTPPPEEDPVPAPGGADEEQSGKEQPDAPAENADPDAPAEDEGTSALADDELGSDAVAAEASPVAMRAANGISARAANGTITLGSTVLDIAQSSISSTYDTTGGFKYDADTKTLTLRNCTIDTYTKVSSEQLPGIFKYYNVFLDSRNVGTLNIVLEGSNYIGNSGSLKYMPAASDLDTPRYLGIWGNTVRFSGSGSLTIAAQTFPIQSGGIETSGSVDLTLRSYMNGTVTRSMAVGAGTSVTAEAQGNNLDFYALNVKNNLTVNGTLDATTNGCVYQNDYPVALLVDGTLRVTGGQVTATSDGRNGNDGCQGYGIKANVLEIGGGGTVRAYSNGYNTQTRKYDGKEAIYVSSNLTVDLGGYLYAKTQNPILSNENENGALKVNGRWDLSGTNGDTAYTKAVITKPVNGSIYENVILGTTVSPEKEVEISGIRNAVLVLSYNEDQNNKGKTWYYRNADRPGDTDSIKQNVYSSGSTQQELNLKEGFRNVLAADYNNYYGIDVREGEHTVVLDGLAIVRDHTFLTVRGGATLNLKLTGRSYLKSGSAPAIYVEQGGTLNLIGGGMAQSSLVLMGGLSAASGATVNFKDCAVYAAGKTIGGTGANVSVENYTDDADTTCNVCGYVRTVTPEAVSVSQITLNKTSTSISVGNSQTLTATVAPENAANKALKWASSDEDVATIAPDGTVTAVKVGTATITATAMDGSGKSATCKVTVTGDTTPSQPGGSTGGSSGGSSSGGGGGSSSTTPTKPETATKPDGTKVETVTKPDGTKVETTTGKDGSVTKTETKTETKPDGTKVETKNETETNKDGSKVESETRTETKKDGTVTESKTETITSKDGTKSETKSETKTDKNGVTSGTETTKTTTANGSTGMTVTTIENGESKTAAEAKVSSKAVEDAKKNGEAVKAPVEVEASRNSSTAPTVKVELPKSAGETKVEIPVSNATPGTVAVLVHPDGTEEILKDSIPTEGGIRLTVNGGATVKIVDNSKNFIDTQDHWAKGAIDFVSARGLVNGMSATIYAPNNSTTRAQLWTILARQNDADLTGGNTWFENAQNWAKEKGISDGANPNAAINRAQMVTMLWRAEGQPAAGGAASFTDVSADSYYAQAMAWAIENGITTGVGGGRFDPTATCTRAQIAAFLARSMK